MPPTLIHRCFKPIKDSLPDFLARPIRSWFTAVLTPILFSYGSGHFRSSFEMAAVSKKGEPLPWYTYPAIDFLTSRDFEDTTVVEFGGGQSSLWWAKRAKHTVTFEGDKVWFDRIHKSLPENVDLFLAPLDDPKSCTEEINRVLNAGNYPKFDIAVIDGLFRREMIEIACQNVTGSGAIIVDDAEGYGFYEGFKDSGMSRVDFFGYAPGVILPHCTSIYFRAECFLFLPENPLPVVG
jgi:hypothetical protein